MRLSPATNVPYPTVSDYLQTPSRDNVVVSILAAGTTSELLTGVLDLEPSQAYTAAATGSIADGNIGITVYNDDREGLPGSADVRAVHASSNAPAVNVLVDAITIAAGATFPNAGAYTAVSPTSSATVSVNLSAGGANVLSESGIVFTSGQTYSVFVIGRVGGPPLDLLVVQDS